jgi:hypothetical protein
MIDTIFTILMLIAMGTAVYLILLLAISFTIYFIKNKP